MIPAIFVAAGLAILIAPFAWLVHKLAFRVVGVAPRRKVIEIRREGDSVVLPRSTLTEAPGRYGLWFGKNFEEHALIGSVKSTDEQHVVRHLVSTSASIPTTESDAQLTGHVMSGPAEIDPNWEDVDVPLHGGGVAPAWLFRADDPAAPWVVHVQGIRTSRLVTLRSVEVAQRAGLTSLVIAYRGAGDGPDAPISYLGQTEWSDLADAIAFARAHGASQVYVVAWSMGAGIALELLRHDPAAFERLALVSPATDWSRIVQNGVRRAGLPNFVAPVVTWAMSSRAASRVIGMPAPLDFGRLDWIDNYPLNVPTLVLHSDGDEEIPFELTEAFAAAHPSVQLVKTATSPHGWEANVDPELFKSTLTSWLSKPPLDPPP